MAMTKHSISVTLYISTESARNIHGIADQQCGIMRAFYNRGALHRPEVHDEVSTCIWRWHSCDCRYMYRWM